MLSTVMDHSPREGTLVIFQWQGMTILAADKKCRRTSFLMDLNDPGSIDRRAISGVGGMEVYNTVLSNVFPCCC